MDEEILDPRFQRKLAIGVFIFLALVVVFSGYAYHRIEIRHILARRYQRLRSVAEEKVKQVSEWRLNLEREVSRPVQSPFFRKALEEWLGQRSDPLLLENWATILRLEKDVFGFEDALLLDRDGETVLLSGTGTPGLMNDATREAVRESMKKGQAVISDPYPGPNGGFWVDAVCPVLDDQGGKMALFLLRANLTSALFRMLHFLPSDGSSTENLLMRKEGDLVFYLSGTVKKSAAPPPSSYDSILVPDPPAPEVAGREGMFVGKDYRGVEVLADLRNVPGTTWFLLSKVDMREVLEEARYKGRVVALFALMAVLLSGTSMGFLFRHKRAKLWKRLYLAEKEIRVLRERQASERKIAEEERKKLENQFIQAQKMEAIGRLAGGVAHDFNNMLSVIVGYSELAISQMDENDPVKGHIQDILHAADRSTTLVRQLLAFARRQVISPRPLDLNETIEGMLKMLRRLVGENIELVWVPGHGLWRVNIDPAQVDQVLANLVVNAKDAISGSGRVTIGTENVDLDESYCQIHCGFVPGQYVMLAISDDGCGMDKDTLGKIFEPFFTTKERGKGTGLGLSTVYGIVKQNSGFVNVYSEKGKGTSFKIYLPALVESTETENEFHDLLQDLPVGTETVLLVEDETSLLELYRSFLEKLGYRVLPAATPSEAENLAALHDGKIDLLLSDVVLPEMSGKDLRERLTRIVPFMKCLFMSGYTADIIAHHGVLEGGVCFLHKPFSMETLARKVRQLLDGPRGDG